MSLHIADAMIDLVVEGVLTIGVSEMRIGQPDEHVVAQLGALPGATTSRQPMYNSVERVWKILTTVRIVRRGVTIIAQRSAPATADELAAARKLWSVP